MLFIFKLAGAGNLHQLQPKESCLIHHTWRNWAWERLHRREEVALLVSGGAETGVRPSGSRSCFLPPQGSAAAAAVSLSSFQQAALACAVETCDSRLCTSQLLTSHCVLERELKHTSLRPWAGWIFPRRSPGSGSLVLPRKLVDKMHLCGLCIWSCLLFL